MAYHSCPVIVAIAISISLGVINLSTLVSSSNPDKNGGYEVTVALAETTPEPQTSSEASQVAINIEESIREFSRNLWIASRGKFFVRYADVLLPSHWTLFRGTLSANFSYNTAAIRVSPNAKGAYVEHSFKCGIPGDFIQLPSSFINSTTGPYGSNGKALLNLWATYRWGVFEEHGYVGDLKYPYVRKDLTTEEWHVTGCSNHPILGEFLDNGDSCSAPDTLIPSSTCRFVVDQNSTTANSSIMHFHWIDSVGEFCDETNHNMISQNRHNSLCNHKSVWEVIRETSDYKSVTDPLDPPLPGRWPLPSIEFFQSSKKPVLYILLDRGKIQDSVSVGLASMAQRKIANFLASIKPYETIATVFTYPGNEGHSIKEEIGSVPIWERTLDIFLKFFGDVNMNGPEHRNFPQAILAVTEEIKKKSHPNGAVLLVVKYGANLADFGSYEPEPKLVNALNDAGVILNSIELQIPNHPGHSHLAELARQTDGTYTVLSNYMEAETLHLPNLFHHLSKVLDLNYAMFQPTYRTLVSTDLLYGNIAKFKVPRSAEATGKTVVTYTTASGTLSSSDFSIEGVTSGISTPVPNLSVRKRLNWLEEGSKWTYSFLIRNEITTGYDELTVRTTCSSCTGTLYVRTNIVEESTQNITVAVSTNYADNNIDMAEAGPVILYAKVLNMTSPVVNGKVTAIITNLKTGEEKALDLVDDGDSSPDQDPFDGLYSQYFIPSRDGEFKVTVVVEGDNLPSAKRSLLYKQVQEQSVNHGKLLPIDQQMGCNGATCDISYLTETFMHSVELPVSIQVSNVSAYVPQPLPVSTIIVYPNINANSLRLSWPAPKLAGNAYLSASSYDMRQSATVEALINEFENQQVVPGVSSLKPSPPGSLDSILLTLPSRSTYYAIRSSYRGQQSAVSFSSFDVKEQIAPPVDPATTPTDSSSSTTEPATPTSNTGSTDVSDLPGSSTGNIGSSTTPDVNPPGDKPTTRAPQSDKKPWAKTGGGIAVITIASIIVAAALIFGIYYVLRSRCSSIKINPPDTQPRSSVLQM